MCATNVEALTPGSSVEPKTIPVPERNLIQESENVKACNTLPSPIRVETLAVALEDHPDPTFTSQLCSNIKNGVSLGYTGPRTYRFSRNLPTAFEHPEIVSSNLATEVSLGRTEGPFKNLQVSPIGLVPKKHSNKYRTIFHLSFPKSGTSSINHHIAKEDFSLQYITIDNAVEGILNFGQGCFLAKTDIESAFRLIPVAPKDYELLGMYWDQQYYYDKVLPFGLRSAPALFNQLSDAVEWILINKCLSYPRRFFDNRTSCPLSPPFQVLQRELVKHAPYL